MEKLSYVLKIFFYGSSIYVCVLALIGISKYSDKLHSGHLLMFFCGVIYILYSGFKTLSFPPKK